MTTNKRNPKSCVWCVFHFLIYISGHFRRHFCQRQLHYSHQHSYSDGDGCHARCWPAHQEQFGVPVSCPRALWHADQGNWTHDLPITTRWLYHSCPVLFIGRYSIAPSFLFHMHLHTRLQCADTQTQKQATAAVCVVTMAISSDFLLHSLEWWEVFRYKGEAMVMARKSRSCAWGGMYCTGDTHTHTHTHTYSDFHHLCSDKAAVSFRAS